MIKREKRNAKMRTTKKRALLAGVKSIFDLTGHRSYQTMKAMLPEAPQPRHPLQVITETSNQISQTPFPK